MEHVAGDGGWWRLVAIQPKIQHYSFSNPTGLKCRCAEAPCVGDDDDDNNDDDNDVDNDDGDLRPPPLANQGRRTTGRVVGDHNKASMPAHSDY